MPFPINRVFYSYDIPGGEDRGAHAHKEMCIRDRRIHSAFFFIDKILANPISFFLGNGSPKEAVNWGLKEGFWISDVGFIAVSYTHLFAFLTLF